MRTTRLWGTSQGSKTLAECEPVDLGGGRAVKSGCSMTSPRLPFCKLYLFLPNPEPSPQLWGSGSPEGSWRLEHGPAWLLQVIQSSLPRPVHLPSALSWVIADSDIPGVEIPGSQ